MATLFTYSAKQVLRGGCNKIVPTSATARLILMRAGFDTPIAFGAFLQPPTSGGANVADAASISTSAAANATQACPLSSHNSSSVSSASTPSIFAASNRCPCGMYPLDSTPTDCPSAATTTTMKATPVNQNKKWSMGGSGSAFKRAGARGFSTQSEAAKPPTPPSTEVTQPAAAANNAAPQQQTLTPPLPPPISLPPVFSAAHAGLLAIEDYRSGIQALAKGSLSSARGFLQRTRDIVAYVPNQPYLGLYLKHLLCCIREKEGRWKEEKQMRGEVLKEVEKMLWAYTKDTSTKVGPTPAPIKETELLVSEQVVSAYVLSALRSGARSDVKQLLEMWLPKLEAMLFGRSVSPPPSPTPGQQSSTNSNTTAAATTSNSTVPAARPGTPQPSRPFSTGASSLRLLAQYLNLIQVGLLERLTRDASVTSSSVDSQKSSKGASPVSSSSQQVHLEHTLSNLAGWISARPYLQSSNEWKLFQGELLLLPNIESIPSVSALLPAASTSSPLSSNAMRAVSYFEQHSELQRMALSESNMQREWYSPLVHAYLAAAKRVSAQPAAAAPADAKADTPVLDVTQGATGTATRSATELLDQCLSYIEQSISDDAAHPYLLRTLFRLSIQAYASEGDAIQAEGLLRNILSKLEGQLGFNIYAPVINTNQLTLDSTRVELYLDVLLEYVFLLTRLEWNKVSRKGEGRIVLYQRLIRLMQADASARYLIEQLLPRARRTLTATPASEPVADWLTIKDATSIPDSLLQLDLNPNTAKSVPTWMKDKLHVGTGIQI